MAGPLTSNATRNAALLSSTVLVACPMVSTRAVVCSEKHHSHVKEAGIGANRRG